MKIQCAGTTTNYMQRNKQNRISPKPAINGKLIGSERRIVELSRHGHFDQNGYRCEVEIMSDDIVVFNSTPNLCFDFKKYGIKIRHSRYYDYILHYVIKNEQLFLCKIETHLSFLCKKSKILGVNSEAINKGKWSIFNFADIPSEYTGTLSIGRTFDYHNWKHDEKTIPVPFYPDAYKENGYIKFEKGRIIEKSLILRDK